MKNLLLLLTLALASSCGTPKEAPLPQPQTFTDVDLVGGWRREPRVWDTQRFAPHVSWKAPDGSEKWLFQAFLFIEGADVVHHKNLSLGPEGPSATKAEWEYQLDLWLGPEGGVSALDKACAQVAGRIGPPEKKRQVILCIPDAIMLENFADKGSSTAYWGDELDFADVQDQIKAYTWYIDESRRRFQALDCQYLELAGFYILSEELNLPYDVPLNCQYKRWETVIPAVAEYAHAAGEGLYWIPYHMAPGYKYWKQLGFDQAWMQPNWYWDLYYGDHPFDKTLQAVKDYGMGMELEFEYSCIYSQMPEGTMGPDGAGKMIFHPFDVPALQGRLRTYMQNYKDADLYGIGSVALYSGSNALTQLATSPVPEDRALYDELCEFIIGNRKMQLAN